MTNPSWQSIKNEVYRRAKGCCEYCQTCEANTGQTLHIEHIQPGNNNSLENLCLACAGCNLSKGQATQAVDPETETAVALFNPRLQKWHEHFEWDTNGVLIIGKSPIGRATIQRLKMNRRSILIARGRWVLGGFHPTSELNESE